MRKFTPPGRVERLVSGHPLFRRMTITRGVSLLKEGGIYRQVEGPSAEEVDAADAAYIGGRVYAITEQEAIDLLFAGYGDWLDGYPYRLYGTGAYGTGPYGGGGEE